MEGIKSYSVCFYVVLKVQVQRGSSQLVTILHRGEGSTGTPNLYHVINGRPLKTIVFTKSQYSEYLEILFEYLCLRK